MTSPFEGRGRQLKTLYSTFPYLFDTPSTHPCVFLFANISIISFIIEAKQRIWQTALLPWALLLLLVTLDHSHLLNAMKKILYVTPFLALSLFFHAFFTPGNILFSVGHLYITREGLIQGIWITQKLAFFFCVSFGLTSGISSLFIFQMMDRLNRLPILNLFGIRQHILTLFLILRWLRVLPLSWKHQLTEIMKDAEGKTTKTTLILRSLPQILKKDFLQMDRRSALFIARGYAEGILRIAETPFDPLSRKDLVISWVILISWGFYILWAVLLK